MYFTIYQDQKEKDGNKGRRASEEAGGSWKEGKKRRDRPNAWVYIPGMSNFIVSKINQASIVIFFGEIETNTTIFTFTDCSSTKRSSSSWDHGFYVFQSNNVGWFGFLVQVRYGTKTDVLLSGIIFFCFMAS